MYNYIGNYRDMFVNLYNNYLKSQFQ